MSNSYQRYGPFGGFPAPLELESLGLPRIQASSLAIVRDCRFSIKSPVNVHSLSLSLFPSSLWTKPIFSSFLPLINGNFIESFQETVSDVVTVETSMPSPRIFGLLGSGKWLEKDRPKPGPRHPHPPKIVYKQNTFLTVTNIKLKT